MAYKLEDALRETRAFMRRTGKTPAEAVETMGRKIFPKLATVDRVHLMREGFRVMLNHEMHVERDGRGETVSMPVVIEGSSAPVLQEQVVVSFLESEYVVLGRTKVVRELTITDCRAIEDSERKVAAGHLRTAEIFGQMADLISSCGVQTIAEIPAERIAEVLG